MAIEAIEILDSAVKIGLGALISGFTTYFVTTKNQKYELSKAFLDRRLNTIESATETIDAYFNSFSRLIAAVDGAYRKHPDESTIRDLDYKFIRKMDTAYCDSRSLKNNAGSKLSLLKLNSAVDIISESSKMDNTVRNKVLFRKEMPTKEELDHWHDTLRDIKDRFFNVISKEYCA